MIFAAVFVISLLFVLFVGREFNAETGTRKFILTTNGFSHFRKGLDVSGGTRLIYKISYDKYEKVYQGTELTAVKKLIENIILKNIDNRISKLGVSDYKSFVQNLDNQHYIVVEIGGIADLDQAKGIIGKTLELEFKLPNKEKTTPASIQARKVLAQQIFAEVSKTPLLMYKLVDGRMSENIFYNAFSGVTLNQLPTLYKNNSKLLDSATPGKLYPSLIDGKYETIAAQDTL
jgi:preprotein translocase subunit SecD